MLVELIVLLLHHFQLSLIVIKLSPHLLLALKAVLVAVLNLLKNLVEVSNHLSIAAERAMCVVLFAC